MITLDYLLKHEKTFPNQHRLANSRIFRFKSGFTLVSVGVGKSPVEVLKTLAIHNSNKPGIEADKFATWYYNNANPEAAEAFHGECNIPDNPITYHRTDQFQKIAVPTLGHMVNDAEEWSYLAFGCDGNKHRGPSIFAMWLCLEGTSPKEATKIANELFGKNWVLPFVRQRIAKLGWDYGNQYPGLRERVKTLMGVA